jgi:hypothetical protein
MLTIETNNGPLSGLDAYKYLITQMTSKDQIEMIATLWYMVDEMHEQLDLLCDKKIENDDTDDIFPLYPEENQQ